MNNNDIMKKKKNVSFSLTHMKYENSAMQTYDDRQKCGQCTLECQLCTAVFSCELGLLCARAEKNEVAQKTINISFNQLLNVSSI